MLESEFHAVREFIVQLVANLEVDSGLTHVGLVQYANNAVETIGLSKYTNTSVYHFLSIHK